jgi:hypothetical protein
MRTERFPLCKKINTSLAPALCAQITRVRFYCKILRIMEKNHFSEKSCPISSPIEEEGPRNVEESSNNRCALQCLPTSKKWWIAGFVTLAAVIVAVAVPLSLASSQVPHEESKTSFIATGSTSELIVTSCGPDEIKVTGGRIGELAPNSNFIYLSDHAELCLNCTPLYRRIISIDASSDPDAFILNTRFMTFGQVVDELNNSPLFSTEIEPIFGCMHSGVDEGLKKPGHRLLASGVKFPETCSGWQEISGEDGKCTYTNCYVGDDSYGGYIGEVWGSSADCFACGRDAPNGNDTFPHGCNNGCGSGDIRFSGDFGDKFLIGGPFDFGDACCFHDYCYSSSTFTKSECETMFHDLMRQKCPPTHPWLVKYLPTQFHDIDNCQIMADMFKAIVTYAADLPPIHAYTGAQEKQREHESKPVCQQPTPTPTVANLPTSPFCPGITACRAADGTCDRANLHNNDNCICPNSCKIMTNTIGEVPNNLGCGLDDIFATNMDIASGSCNGGGASSCYGSWKTIGARSCIGGGCTGDFMCIGSDSCNGDGACNNVGNDPEGGMRTEIGSFSCNGKDSCFSFYDAGVRIGDHSCGKESSCFLIEAPVTIGSNSCNGGGGDYPYGACNQITVSVGDGSCNCENCCSCRSSAPVGDFQCNDGPEACSECW